MKESDLEAFIAQDPTRWAKTLHKADSPPIPMEVVTGTEALAQARAALLALVHLLLPEGQPIALRLLYGWQTFPLAEINDLLRHADTDLGQAWTIHATGGRAPSQLVTCTTPEGGIARYGVFELRRLPIMAVSRREGGEWMPSDIDWSQQDDLRAQGLSRRERARRLDIAESTLRDAEKRRAQTAQGSSSGTQLGTPPNGDPAAGVPRGPHERQPL